jgi:hypothetical protein
MNRLNQDQAIREDKPIAAKLKCVVCLMMLTKPYYKCCGCSKSHCSFCEEDSAVKSECTLCHQKTYLQQHDDLLVDLKFHCRKEHCKKVFDYNSILGHEATCVRTCEDCFQAE